MKHTTEKKQRSATEERYRKMYSLARQFESRVSFSSDKRSEKEIPFFVFGYEKDNVAVEYANLSVFYPYGIEISKSLRKVFTMRRIEDELLPPKYGKVKLCALAFAFLGKVSISLSYSAEPNPKAQREMILSHNSKLPVERNARYAILASEKPKLP